MRVPFFGGVQGKPRFPQFPYPCFGPILKGNQPLPHIWGSPNKNDTPQLGGLQFTPALATRRDVSDFGKCSFTSPKPWGSWDRCGNRFVRCNACGFQIRFPRCGLEPGALRLWSSDVGGVSVSKNQGFKSPHNQIATKQRSPEPSKDQKKESKQSGVRVQRAEWTVGMLIV